MFLARQGAGLIDIKADTNIWKEYYDGFPYFKADAVRSGCEPRKMVHPGGSDRAIVLLHGLTDSPYAMLAIGEYFYKNLGYNVFLPLLQCHGLKRPGKMIGVSLAEWKRNVEFAVESAADKSATVSIGGFSTGGALGFYFAATDSRITGDLYLFSAAFGLYGGPGSIFSRAVEYLLTKPLLHLFTLPTPLIGVNPYRYARVPFNSVRELVALMWENNSLLQKFKKKKKFKKRIFSAWTAADRVVSVDAIKDFAKVAASGRYFPFEIGEEKNVHHACLILADPIYEEGSPPGSDPLEMPNPCFDEMMDAMRKFEEMC